MVKKDLLRYWDIARGNWLSRIISVYRSPGAHAVVIFRFGSWIKKRNILLRLVLDPVYFLLTYFIHIKWGIDLNRSAEIGEGFYVGHHGGIEVSGRIKAGRNFTISQRNAIGGYAGKGKNRGVPTFGDDVYIGPGAVVFGKITVGNNVKIGANAVIYKDIPDNAIVVLDPGFKIISYKGNYPIED